MCFTAALLQVRNLKDVQQLTNYIHVYIVHICALLLLYYRTSFRFRTCSKAAVKHIQQLTDYIYVLYCFTTAAVKHIQQLTNYIYVLYCCFTKGTESEGCTRQQSRFEQLSNKVVQQLTNYIRVSILQVRNLKDILVSNHFFTTTSILVN